MKNRFLMLMLTTMLAFTSLSVLADEDSCNPNPSEPPDSEPGECMSIELGE